MPYINAFGRSYKYHASVYKNNDVILIYNPYANLFAVAIGWKR